MYFLRGVVVVLPLVVLLLCLPARASAYTDPGSATLLLQVLLAVFAGVVYRLRSFLRRVVRKDR
jgi:hypothetical protein